MRREQERARFIVFELSQMIDWYEDGAQPLPHGGVRLNICPIWTMMIRRVKQQVMRRLTSR